MDTDLLFEKYTVEENRTIEKKTRQDIEKKKEELRQLVGERYRELIEAADTITSMRTSMENITQSINRVQGLCQGFLSAKSLPEKPSMLESLKRKEQLQLFGTLTGVKLLMDMPEQIWSALDEKQYLTAARLFLLARHVHTKQQLDPQSSYVLTHFPILERQWKSINHLKNTILQNCQNCIRATNISNKIVTECLCSILLLEDTTVQEVFEEFLKARTDSIQLLFSFDSIDTSVKQQMSDVVRVVMTTICQIYAVFYSDVDNRDNQLMTVLNQLTTAQSNDSFFREHFSSYKCVPSAVKDFLPLFKHKPEPLDRDLLVAQSQVYLKKWSESIRNGAEKSLLLVPNIKGLTAIRDEIWSVMKEESSKVEWIKVNEIFVERKIQLWEETLRQLFLDRILMLLRSQLDTMVTSCTQSVTKLMTTDAAADSRLMFETDLMSYIWMEGPSDFPADVAWGQANSRSLLDSGALLMKVRAFSPSVQGLCQSLEHKLHLLLDDVRCFTQTDDSTESASADPSHTPSPFDKLADKNRILDSLCEITEISIIKLFDHLRTELHRLKQTIVDKPMAERQIINRVLLLGRFGCAVCELNYQLQLCMNTSALDDALASQRSNKRVVSTGRGHITDSPRWQSLKAKLTDFSIEAFEVWTDHAISFHVEQFRRSVLDTSPRNVLHNSTQWDSITIDEETESGQKVKSVIQVPMQASWNVQKLIHNLCDNISQIGGHAIHRAVIRKLINSTLDGVLESYEELLKEKRGDVLPQRWSLQLLFDVRFISGMLTVRDDTGGKRQESAKVKDIVHRLESFVDPFDLDVFYPYIQNHVTKQTQRNAVFYGVLNYGDKVNAYTTTSTSVLGQQEQHNILQLSTGQNRFTLFPAGSQLRESSLQPSIWSPKQLGPLGTGLPTPEIPLSQRNVPSSSFLGQMSTIWFSNTGAK